MRRCLALALSLTSIGCLEEHAPWLLGPEEGEPGPTLRETPAEGLSVVGGASGGQAEPIPLPVALTRRVKPPREARRTGSRGRLGARRRGAVSLGIGGAGRGAGGLGMGRGGGRGGGAIGPTPDGQRITERRRVELELSPFQYAELELPFRGGTPGEFPVRRDAEISPTVSTEKDWLSTFAIDVDTAAYTLARSSLVNGRLPEPSLVRPEEMLNYFRYDYLPPEAQDQLFSIEADGTRSPLESERYLLRVGIQARAPRPQARLPVNLVFLVDTSCSMTGEDRLDLAQRSMVRAARHLGPDDQVAITTYAGGVSLVLPPTPSRELDRIEGAIEGLRNGGGTAMQSGLSLAYQQAEAMRRPGSYTRVVVLSDGDANIGSTTPEQLLADIAEYQARGITLSTIGFGNGNYRDDMMEKLANRGNGNYFYVDSDRQSERVFVRDLHRMIEEVASDVKIQVELDADAVVSYRLVGYENRAIADEDFRNDQVDAGEIGEDHQVTALYELQLREGAAGRLATIRVRAKQPGGQLAKETSLRVPVAMVTRPFGRATPDLRFATAVLGAAELLRHSEYSREWTWKQVLSIARSVSGSDPDRQEFVALVERAQALSQVAAR